MRAPLAWVPPSKPPSPHFSWAEVLHNSGYARVPLGPTSIGRGRFVMTPRRNARRQAEAMEKVRARVNAERQRRGFKPTYLRVLSWARSFEHNRQVGGAGNSQHLYFDACDVSRQEIERLLPWQGGRETFDRILEAVFATGGIGLYVAGNRHCDSRGFRARWTTS